MKEALQRVSGMVLLAAIGMAEGMNFISAYLFLIAGVIYFSSNIGEKYTKTLRAGIYCVIMCMPATSIAFGSFVKTIVFFTVAAMIVLYYILENKNAKTIEF